MSKLRNRSKTAREIESKAEAMGYQTGRTTTGHLRFIHSITGKTVITPSKASGSLLWNAYAELKRGTRL